MDEFLAEIRGDARGGVSGRIGICPDHVGSDGVVHKCMFCVGSERVMLACVSACRGRAVM